MTVRELLESHVRIKNPNEDIIVVADIVNPENLNERPSRPEVAIEEYGEREVKEWYHVRERLRRKTLIEISIVI